MKDDLIKKILSEEQLQFLDGLMLGDGSLVYSSNRSRNPRLVINRQIKDKNYLFWQYEVLKDFYNTEPKYYKYYDKRTHKNYEKSYLISKSDQIFQYYYEIWYPNKKKIVSKDLKLNPLTLLVWFLDDGCTVIEKNSIITKFSTDGFEKNDTEFLQHLLQDFLQEKVNLYKKENGCILKFSTATSIKMIDIIDPIFPQCMERKRMWRNFNWNYLENNKKMYKTFNRK